MEYIMKKTAMRINNFILVFLVLYSNFSCTKDSQNLYQSENVENFINDCKEFHSKNYRPLKKNEQDLTIYEIPLFLKGYKVSYINLGEKSLKITFETKGVMDITIEGILVYFEPKENLKVGNMRLQQVHPQIFKFVYID